MAEINKNIWAPWRMEYIRSIDDETEQIQGCFLCHYFDTPEKDREHHVLWRTEHVLVMLNRFPYTNGHLMVVPRTHSGDPLGLPEAEIAVLTSSTYQAVSLLQKVYEPQGLNVGMNLGKCAGAGVPDHVHNHIVPRWDGDTNFMTVLGGVRVVPDSLDATYDELMKVAIEMGIIGN